MTLLLSALRSENVLAFANIALAGAGHYLHTVYNLPAPSRPWVILWLGNAVLIGLGWYNARHGGSRFEIRVGLLCLYLALLANGAIAFDALRAL